MAERGIQVRVVVAGRHVLTLGVEHAPRWQRAVTGARHVRYAGWPRGRRVRLENSLIGHSGEKQDAA